MTHTTSRRPVNDIKGELYQRTAGYRKTLGKVFVFGPTDYSHKYNPLQGRETEEKLYSSAKHLLYDPNDKEAIFTERATKMLTQLFMAARHEKQNHFADVRKKIRLGPKDVAMRLYAISPELAMHFLGGDMHTNILEDRFFTSAWETLTSRLYPLLTENVVRCFSGSDFTPQEIMTSDTPITVYLKWPEADLLAYRPLIRLVWDSLINRFITTYDETAGKNCKPLLLLLDEAGRSEIPHLPHYATTVAGRGISLIIAVAAQ